MKYHMPCPHCSREQYLKWGGKNDPFGIKWEGDNPKTAYYLCEHCKKPIQYSALSTMLEQGVWRDENRGVWLDQDDLFRSVDGAVIDAPEHVGFSHLWAAYSPFTSWSRLVDRWVKASKKARQGDNSQLKAFVNTQLGETWEEDIGEKLESETFYQRREFYPVKNGQILVPDKVAYITVGGDTQDDRLEWEVVGWGAGEESWSLDYQVLHGNLSLEHIWQVLAEKLRTTWLREDGRLMNIGLVCWDSGGHYTDEVYALSKQLGLRWFIPTKGENRPGKPVVNFPRKRNRKGVYLTFTGGDNAKELVYQRLNITPGTQGTPTPGCCHWPINEETHGHQYFDQLIAETKTLRFVGGKRIYTYICPPGKRNEVLDCRVGALAAVRIAQQYMGITLEAMPYASGEVSPEKKRKKVHQSSWL